MLAMEARGAEKLGSSSGYTVARDLVSCILPHGQVPFLAAYVVQLWSSKWGGLLNRGCQQFSTEHLFEATPISVSGYY